MSTSPRYTKPLPRSGRELVLRALRDNGGMTRADLARYASVSPSTVTAIVQELLVEGVIVDSHAGSSSELGRTRRGSGLTLNPNAGVVVGVDFGFRHVRVLLCDLAHNIVASGERELHERHTSEEALVETRELLDELLESSGRSRNALIGAGVALPGPVRHHTPDQVVTSAILPGWSGVSSSTVANVLGLPVRLDNDGNLAALGERMWGAAQGYDDCVVLKFHSGIGCGLIVNGELVRGALGGAGEIGHTTVDERGPLCRCGKRGCLDSFASVPAMIESLRLQHGDLSLRDLMALVRNDDAGAIRVVRDAAELVGMTLAAACNLLSPQRVVVVGAMSEAGDLILDPIRSALQKNVAPSDPPEVVMGTLGKSHTALGAVAMALEETAWLRELGWTSNSTSHSR